MKTKNDVLDFWFKELEPKEWYSKNHKLDQKITDFFLETHKAATKGELFSWRTDVEGRLAEILVLDQFSRNMFRDSPKAFEFDGLALALAQEASLKPELHNLGSEKKSFVYMPFMHSESFLVHEEALRLFSQPGLENSLEFELKHKKIIERFGRYPHRNKTLGRESTAEEIEFLKEPGSSF